MVLAALWLVAALIFAADTAEAALHPYLGADRPAELWVQSVSWGPLAQVMDFTNWIGGVRQAVVAVTVIVLALLLVSRAAALLLVAGSGASLLENIVKLLVHRHRPTPGLVHVQERVSGYSYPSGHATFFTWVLVLLAITVAPRLPRAWRPAAYTVAVLLALVACLGRVWAGAHWPSDVLGGFLLSLLWIGIVCAAAQRSTRWRRGLQRPQAAAAVPGQAAP